MGTAATQGTFLRIDGTVMPVDVTGLDRSNGKLRLHTSKEGSSVATAAVDDPAN